MDRQKLKEMLDKAESMGYDRGVLTILVDILKLMDESKMNYVSYKSIKDIHDRYAKDFKLKE